MKDKIGKIAALCYQISEETKIDVFFDYQAHACSISIRVYKFGWTENNTPASLKCCQSCFGIYLDIEVLQIGIEDKIISELEAMLEEGKNE